MKLNVSERWPPVERPPGLEPSEDMKVANQHASYSRTGMVPPLATPDFGRGVSTPKPHAATDTTTPARGPEEAGTDLGLEFAELAVRVRKLPPMTEEQRNEQRASFAYGSLALMREYADATPEQLEHLRQLCRKAAGCTP